MPSPEPTADWKHRIRVKQFMTVFEDRFSVSQSMNQIADALENHPLFEEFYAVTLFRETVCLEEANDLLDEFYDYCDARDIWVE